MSNLVPLRDMLRQVRETQLPEADWFSQDIHPAIVSAARKIFLAYRIDTAGLYKYKDVLAHPAPKVGPKLQYLLLAMAEAAQGVLDEQAREDNALELSEDSPFLALHNQGGLPPPDSQPPNWQSNSAYRPDPNSRLRAQRNLSGALNGVAPATNALGETAGVQAEGPQPNELPAPPPANQDAAHVADQEREVFERQRIARDAVFQTRHAQANAQAGIRDNTVQTGEQASSSITFGSVPQPERISQPAAGGSQAHIGLMTPQRRPQRSNSSPQLTMSAMDLSKLQETQRRRILGMKITFHITDYLDHFILQVSAAFVKTPQLDDGDRADLIITMLSPEVKQRCAGKSALISPGSPKDVFDMLRLEFRPRPEQCLIDLTALVMSEKEGAITFVQRARDIYVKNQVALPRSHTELMGVYMKGSAGFIKHCQNAYSMAVSVAGVKPGTDLNLNWDQLQDWAREHDQSRAVMTGIRSSRSREVTGLKSNQVMSGRTRSSTSNVSAAEPVPIPERGRSQQRDQSQDRRRSASNRSYRSNDSPSSFRSNGGTWHGRNRSTSSTRDQRTSGTPGSTPYRKPTPSGPNVNKPGTHFILPGLDYIRMNLVSAVKAQEQVAEVDSHPLVFSTLPGFCLKDLMDGNTPIVGVHATSTSNKRPNLPEAIAQDDLDKDNQPLNLPEAMRRGLARAADLPVQSPYAKILNAQFMLTFRQLASLCLDEEFAHVCKILIDCALKREQRREDVATTSAAVDIFTMAMRELPLFRIPRGSTVCQPELVELQTPCATSQPEMSVVMSVIHMADITAYLDDDRQEQRHLRLDSGAAISCISEETLAEDSEFLLSRGKKYGLITPMTLSGFASAHARVTHVIVGAQLIIGDARCTQNFLVVPKLVCGYLMGHDFIRDYDIYLQLSKRRAVMSIPPDEWIGTSSYRSTQGIDVGFVSETAVLQLGAP